MDTDEQQQQTTMGLASKLDYTHLKRQFKATTGPSERQQLQQQFRNDIEARTASLARAAPNLKAVEQYDAVQVPA